MQADLAVVDFTLASEEIACIENLNRGLAFAGAVRLSQWTQRQSRALGINPLPSAWRLLQEANQLGRRNV